MGTTAAEKTVEVLRTLFARYGLPQNLVSDNGPQFMASCFAEFLSTNRIQHLKSPPYHTNGEAGMIWECWPQSCQFLLRYHPIPHTTTGVSPAELFL